MNENIQSIFPLMSYENGCLVSVDGDISIVLRVTLPEAYNLDAEGYQALHDFWLKAISHLPEMTIIHKQDIFYRNKYEGKFTDCQSPLQRAYEYHFNEREYIEHECLITLTLCTAERLNGQSTFSTLCRKSIVPKDINTERITSFVNAVDNFKSVLSYLLTIDTLSESELLGTRNWQGVIERYISIGYENTYQTLNDLTFKDRNNKAFSQPRSGDNQMFFYTIPSSKLMPEHLSASRIVSKYSTDVSNMVLSFASPLGISCYCNHIYNQYLFIQNTERTLRKLESDLRNMKSLSLYSRANRVNAHILEKFLDDVHSSGERIVKAHFNIMGWADSMKEKEYYKKQIAPAFSSMGIMPHYANEETPLLFWAGLPGNAADLPSENLFVELPSSMLCMFTGETIYKNSKSDFGIKLSDRDSGRPVLVDISDLPMKKGVISNRNKFVLGPSGTGKSFFMNHMLRNYYSSGASIVLIDIGNSYEGLCNFIHSESENKDGTYVTCSDYSQFSFNPFRRGDTNFDDETIINLTALLVSLWKKPDDSVAMVEENFIEDMLDRYLKLDSANGSFNGFYRYIKKCMPKEPIRKQIAENFLMVLSPYYEGGRYDKLLNSNNITADSMLSDRFVVFEIDAIKDNPVLMTVASIVIMELFITKMKTQKGIRKMFVIEEAWRALATERMASYIKYLYKTVRKYFGEAIIVTQEVDDVLSSSIVKESIINNSDCKILMDESRYLNRFSEIQDALGITEKQKAEILSINQSNNPQRTRYNELWIGLGSRFSKVYSLEVSKEEYFTYTTEETEKKRVKDLAEKLGSYTRAIELLANE